MTYHRLAYDDAATTSEMVSDAREAGRTLRIPDQLSGSRTLADDRGPADPKGPVVSEEVARRAAGLVLHWD